RPESSRNGSAASRRWPGQPEAATRERVVWCTDTGGACLLGRFPFCSLCRALAAVAVARQTICMRPAQPCIARDRPRRVSMFSLLSAAGRTISIFLARDATPMDMSNPNLDDLRRRIDEIDDRLHDLLMQRTEVVEAVAASKRLDEAPALRPGREAAIVRRLVARHAGHFPPGALVRMWREMFSAMVGLQTGFAVAVYVGEAGNGYWDLARDHFGSHSAM